MIRTDVQTVTIATSATQSAAFHMPNASLISALIPVITSCQLFLLGSNDDTSGDYRRIKVLNGSDAAINAGAGSCSANLGTALEAFTRGKIEAGVAQAATRTFQIIFKLA